MNRKRNGGIGQQRGVRTPIKNPVPVSEMSTPTEYSTANAVWLPVISRMVPSRDMMKPVNTLEQDMGTRNTASASASARGTASNTQHTALMRV